jgi:hypothetical protein
MTEHQVTDRAAEQPGTRLPVVLAWVAVQGLIIGLVSVTGAASLAWAIGKTGEMEPSTPCHHDQWCVPDARPLMIAIILVPVVVMSAGPLAARLLRLPSPWFFVMPPLVWVGLLVCVLLADFGNRWPFTDAFSTLSILVLLYPLVAVWVTYRHRKSRLGFEPKDPRRG